MAARVSRAVWKQLSFAEKAAPAARSSHIVDALCGKICVFGGEDAPRNAFDGVPHFMTSSGRWDSTRAPLPGLPRLGHGAASLGSKLHVFGGRLGGTTLFTENASNESAEFFAYDDANDAWSQWDPTAAGGPVPEARSFHAMCAGAAAGRSGLIFVFGGCGSRGRLNDLWSFDPSSNDWRCLHPGGVEQAPAPRGGARLVATCDGSRLVLLFGFSGKQQGDIAVFDLETGRWQLHTQGEQKGDVPSPRSVFAAARLVEKNTVIMFGGESVESAKGHEGAGEFGADLFALDLDSLTWERLQAGCAHVPTARGWGGMAALDSKQLILFGGLDQENARLGDTWALTIE
eukprot:TRINITY_DN55020_c0_g1_i1.p1 TRINITY_DN55020_c0_g1~~TRINITY_DN55020_c0_g1_i1.p1  ORF type:complete len:345 (-),score=44.78 TRINITY_DN55020_c0_g1_i1:128-1162(-)